MRVNATLGADSFAHTGAALFVASAKKPFVLRQQLLGVGVAEARRLFSVCDIAATNDGVLFANRIGVGGTLKSLDLGASWSDATAHSDRFAR